MMSSQTLITIMKKEFLAYFKSPLGYVFIVIFLLGMGQLTFELGRGSFFYLREASMGAFFKYIPWMFLLLIPAVSMRLWAEERKTGTIELLLTMPITVTEAVLGKFFASWLFILVTLAATFPMVLTVIYLGSPDLGRIFLGYIGSMLVAGTMLAIGSFFSALSKNQVISFILTVVVCTIFIMAGSPPILELLNSILPSYFVSIFEAVSLLNQFESIERGVFALSNMWYFFVIIPGFLIANIHFVESIKAN